LLGCILLSRGPPRNLLALPRAGRPIHAVTDLLLWQVVAVVVGILAAIAVVGLLSSGGSPEVLLQQPAHQAHKAHVMHAVHKVFTLPCALPDA
jgi:hypothetical protein